jgi:hypothetical protein
MKKIIYIILFALLFLLPSNIFASNTNVNIEKAILVENYIKKHKERIKGFIIKYELKNDSVLNNSLKELNESIIALEQIQNTNIENKKADKIINAIIIRVKNINEELKIKFRKAKKEFKNKIILKKQLYSKL